MYAGGAETGAAGREGPLTTRDPFFNAIASSMGEGLIIVDAERKIRYMNPVAERISGLDAAACVGRVISDLLKVKDDRTGTYLQSPVAAALASGEIQRLPEEAVLVSESGKACFVDGTISTIRDPSGGILGAVILFRDVTERMRAHRELVESKAYLQSVIAFMPLGVHQYRLDDSGELRFMGANPAADAMLGVDHRELVGKAILEAFPSLEGTDIPMIYRRIALGGPPEHKEEVAYQDERIVGAYEVNAFNIGERSMVAVFSDILERKTAEIERDRFFEISDDIVLQGTLEGRFTEVNAAATRILGWSREDLLSRSWKEFVHPEDSAASAEAMKDLASGNMIVKTENRWLHKDGSYRWLSWASIYIREDGKVLSVVRDLTEEKKRLETQGQRDKMEAIGRLAGGVAHDFNNQLAGILGCAEIVQARLPRESELQEYIGLIIKSAKNSADLAGQLLAFARKGKYQNQAIDLGAVVKETSAILSLTIDRKITVRCELPAESIVIEGDPSQVQNAVMNLGINARDAMPEGGTLRFAVDRVELDCAFLRANQCPAPAGAFALVSVIDTGVGMDSSTRQHLFEPFFSTKAEGQGTGLGLAAVYGIVKNHRGIVNVETAEGKGTVFRLYFPLSEKNLEPATAAGGHPRRVEGACGMILVVDDENVICMMAQAMLGMAGYQVETAQSGAQALEYLKGHPCPDLVILDMIMPDLSGAEVFERIRAIHPGARVLVSSGYSLDGAAQELLDKGAAGFIQKPYRKDALFAAVAAGMGKP